MPAHDDPDALPRFWRKPWALQGIIGMHKPGPYRMTPKCQRVCICVSVCTYIIPHLKEQVRIVCFMDPHPFKRWWAPTPRNPPFTAYIWHFGDGVIFHLNPPKAKPVPDVDQGKPGEDADGRQVAGHF